jgi:hypothetical protein
MHFKTVKQVLTIQGKEIDHILKMDMYIYFSMLLCSYFTSADIVFMKTYKNEYLY